MSFLFPSSTITFEAALRDLTSRNPRARALAAHALGDLDDPTEKRRAVEALIGVLEDDRPEVRAEACSSLGDLGEVAAAPGLVKRLDDGATPVRQNAAIALGTLRAADGFDPLVQALREGPVDLRFQAATSLAEIDPRRSFEYLLTALSDKDPQVAGSAALALGVIPGRVEDPGKALETRARTALVEHLDHDDATTRFDVAYALADLGDPAGRTVLARGLADSERAWDAVTALSQLGSEAEIDELAASLTDRLVPPEATLLAAGVVLKHRPSEPAKRVLLAGLVARKTHVRGLAVEQLTEIGGDWAVAPLEKMATSSKNEELLEVIADALRAIAKRPA